MAVNTAASARGASQGRSRGGNQCRPVRTPTARQSPPKLRKSRRNWPAPCRRRPAASPGGRSTPPRGKPHRLSGVPDAEFPHVAEHRPQPEGARHRPRGLPDEEHEEIPPRAAHQVGHRDHVDRQEDHPAPAAGHVPGQALPIQVRDHVGAKGDQPGRKGRPAGAGSAAAAPARPAFISRQTTAQAAAASSARIPPPASRRRTRR